MSTAVAPPNANKFPTFLATYKNRIIACIPQTAQKYLTPDRMLSICAQAVQKDTRLLNCHPLSVINAIVYLAQIGLEPRPREAYLVAFGKECVPIVDYRGMIDLARRSGMVKDVGAAPVFERDEFDYELGSRPFVRHKPVLDRDRGQLIAAWSVAFYTDGTPATPAIMSRSEIEHIRSKSKAAQDGPWVTDYDRMAMKSAVRREMNLMPQKGDYIKASDLDDAIERSESVPVALEHFEELMGEIDPQPENKGNRGLRRSLHIDIPDGNQDHPAEKATVNTGSAPDGPNPDSGTPRRQTQSTPTPQAETASGKQTKNGEASEGNTGPVVPAGQRKGEDVVFKNMEDATKALREARLKMVSMFSDVGANEYDKYQRQHGFPQSLAAAETMARELSLSFATLLELHHMLPTQTLFP